MQSNLSYVKIQSNNEHRGIKDIIIHVLYSFSFVKFVVSEKKLSMYFQT